MLNPRALRVALPGALLLSFSAAALAAPPPPSGAHPRIFLSASVRDAFTQAMGDSKSAVSALIAQCASATANPSSLMTSGYQGDKWSLTASACALAWQLTGDAAHAATGLKLWRALLEDVDMLGDKKACVAGADEKTATASIRRDTDYAIRYIGPHTALLYDWMHDAPGVTEAFRQQTRDCFRNWITYYTREGYLNNTPGSNYNAGYVGAKTLISIAEAGEDGASSDKFWADTVDVVFGQELIGNGLGPIGGANKAALVGSDWPEGWQYAPQSVVEYAFSTRALVEQGVDLTAMGGWSSDLALRGIYSLVPDQSGIYVGGDFDPSTPFEDPKTSHYDATLISNSSAQAAGWASFMLHQLFTAQRTSIWQAIADARAVTPIDPQQPPLPLWSLAAGTRNLFARSSWGQDAYWAVFTSPPRLVPDHQHTDASNFTFVRGADPLVVDPSPYGSRSSLTGNALTVDSKVVTGDYAPSQTLWSGADMPLVRGTQSGVVAARSDFAKAFNFTDTPSDIPLARRDWVFLPEGEIITIDRITTGSASQKAYLRFRTPGTLAATQSSPFIAKSTVGASALAIHTVALQPASTAPVLRSALVSNDCDSIPNPTPFGACRVARFAVDEYSWEAPGPDILAIHVLDGLGASDATADVAPVNAPPIDTTPAQNAGIIGASVYRSQKQTFVAETATLPPPTTVSYGLPGANPTRHVFFDAPADSTGHTTVTATADGDRCLVTLTAGPGVTAGPAIFTLTPASDGCKVSEDANVPPGQVSPGTGGFDHPGGGGPTGGGGGASGGCSCGLARGLAHRETTGALGIALAVAAAIVLRRRRRNR